MLYPLLPDLLPLSSSFPSRLPIHLALTPTTARIEISFLDVPTVPDHSTFALYCTPSTTAAAVIEDVCSRHGLIRRLTIGGETKGRGRDKWGGGEKVEYALEEVWTNDAEEEGEYMAEGIEDDAHSERSAMYGQLTPCTLLAPLSFLLLCNSLIRSVHHLSRHSSGSSEQTIPPSVSRTEFLFLPKLSLLHSPDLAFAHDT